MKNVTFCQSVKIVSVGLSGFNRENWFSANVSKITSYLFLQCQFVSEPSQSLEYITFYIELININCSQFAIFSGGPVETTPRTLIYF